VSVDGFDLSGKRALVVGADSQAGRAVAAGLAEAGARVAEAGRAGPGRADRLVAESAGQLGGLDIVASCGDLRMAGPFTELSDAEWDRLVAVNLTENVQLLRAAGRVLLAGGGGRIIVLVSMLGERGVANTAAYGACQAALMQLIRALSLEWARQNVRINGIGLGWLEGDPLLSGETPDQLIKYLPARRLGRPDEIGALAVYLASDQADMMTGQTIFVDGAITSHA